MWCFKYSNQSEQGQSTNIALRDELKNKYPDFCNILGRGERLRGPWVQIVLKVKSKFIFLEGGGREGSEEFKIQIPNFGNIYIWRDNSNNNKKVTSLIWSTGSQNNC